VRSGTGNAFLGQRGPVGSAEIGARDEQCSLVPLGIARPYDAAALVDGPFIWVRPGGNSIAGDPQGEPAASRNEVLIVGSRGFGGKTE
jgi:hypothetical protein